jgi:hypothetical protein
MLFGDIARQPFTVGELREIPLLLRLTSKRNENCQKAINFLKQNFQKIN